MLEKPIGVRLPATLKRDEGNPRLGDLVCDAMRQASGAAIALQNRGGVRADLPAGELRFGQVFEVLPFDNQVAVLTLSGAQVRAFVAALMKRHDGLAPFQSGLRVRGDKMSVDLMLADGKPFEVATTYRVATSDFLSQGSESIDKAIGPLAEGALWVLPVSMRDALITYLQGHFGAGPRPR